MPLPQGGVISPLLANIFLHHVLDDCFMKEVKPRLKGQCFLVRFADDFVIGFENEEDARRAKSRKGFWVIKKKTCKKHFKRTMKSLWRWVP